MARTGAPTTTLPPDTATAWPKRPGGVSSLTLDDDGYIHVFTADTGMHQYYDAQGLAAVPESSTYALVAGLATLVAATWHRRRTGAWV